MNAEFGGTFSWEAKRRFPDKLVSNGSQVEAWIERGAHAGELAIDIARFGNPSWQRGVEKVRPPLVYGTVDGVGNAAEMISMMSMSKKLGVPMMLFLDDNAHTVASAFERLTKDSLPLLGISAEEFDMKLSDMKHTQIRAADFLPNKIIGELEDLGIKASELSVAETYRQALYLLAVEIEGDDVLDRLSIVPVREAMENTIIGELPLESLREKVSNVALKMGREDVVFAHTSDEEKIRSNASVGVGILRELYQNGGWLGGTAWTTLTALMIDDIVFDGAGPLILGEKDTKFGQNFAVSYEVVGQDIKPDRMKVATTAVRRIKANNMQSGGDGVDPLILLLWIKRSPLGQVAVAQINEMMDSAFPIGDEKNSEKTFEVGDAQKMMLVVQKQMKQTLGIDGGYLKDRGLSGPQIGEALKMLSQFFLDGNLNDLQTAEILINQIKK